MLAAYAVWTAADARGEGTSAVKGQVVKVGGTARTGYRPSIRRNQPLFELVAVSSAVMGRILSELQVGHLFRSGRIAKSLRPHVKHKCRGLSVDVSVMYSPLSITESPCAASAPPTITGSRRIQHSAADHMYANGEGPTAGLPAQLLLVLSAVLPARASPSTARILPG